METIAKERAQSRRGALKLTAFLAILLMALIALNAPITFAGTGGANGSSGTATLTQSTSTHDNAIADVAEKANPATVTIFNLQQQQLGPFSRRGGDIVPVASGSGYIIDEAGHVVTNNHVVEGGAEFQVQFMDGTTVDATLVGSDIYQDVAVLKLDLSAGQKVPGFVTFGDSSKVRTGDTVIAIGSPFGEYANTVTAGIINATDRSLDTGYGFLMPNLFQHDAQIYPGNSGGPLLNTDGEVIGMNVAKAVDPSVGFSMDTNIGFAIESNAVKALVDEIIATGHVARPYLGIRAQPTMQGQAVISVEADGPAAKAGLKAGDVITAIDGQEIDADHPFINQLIFNHKPGDTVELKVDRDGSSTTISVTLAERPATIA